MIRQQNVFELVTLCSATCRSARVRARSSALPQQSKQKKALINGWQQTATIKLVIALSWCHFSLFLRDAGFYTTHFYFIIFSMASAATLTIAQRHIHSDNIWSENYKKKSKSQTYIRTCAFSSLPIVYELSTHERKTINFTYLLTNTNCLDEKSLKCTPFGMQSKLRIAQFKILFSLYDLLLSW